MLPVETNFTIMQKKNTYLYLIESSCKSLSLGKCITYLYILIFLTMYGVV